MERLLREKSGRLAAAELKELNLSQRLYARLGVTTDAENIAVDVMSAGVNSVATQVQTQKTNIMD